MRTISLDRARASPGRRELIDTAVGTIATIATGERRADVAEVVLVHGITDSADTWHAVLDPLAAHTRVHAVDLPGHGLSDLFERPPSVAELADAVIAYLDARDVSSSIVVGNSLGGGVALGVCARDPSRTGGGVLLGSIGASFPIPFPLTLLRHRPFGELMAWVVGRPLRRLLMRESFVPGFRPGADYVADYFGHWRVAGRAAAVRSMLRALDPGEPSAWLPGIDVPVHVVHGELDRLIPIGIADQVAAGLPASELTILAGVGHTPQHQVPERTTAIVVDALRHR